jgi:pilus assembly protein CpaE
VQIAVTLVGSEDRALLMGLRERGFRVAPVAAADLDTTHPPDSKGPDAFVFDTRALSRLPREVGQAKRHFPGAGIVVVARALEPTEMLEAMRLGVSEWVAEPFNLEEVSAAIRRVARTVAPKPVTGRTVAVLGAKGGVGSTTVAVNLAAALQAEGQSTLLMDLHLAHGDAALFCGVDPRFSVLDALENIQRMDETYFKGLVTPTKAGPDLLGSSTRAVQGSVDAMRVRALLEFGAAAYRYVVLDCPRADAAMIDALDAVSTILVVANQELSALRAASRMASALRMRCGADRVKLAIGRFDAQSDIKLPDVEQVLGGPVKYVFPSDYRTAVAALNRGEPLIVQHQGRLADAFHACAREIAGVTPPPKEAARAGLFGLLGARRLNPAR